MQIDDSGVERPIAFHSRRLNKAELKYGITDREALAGVECAKKWRHLLLQHPCVWVTDHAACTSLRHKQDIATERLARYAMILMEYDLDIVHRPGRDLCFADLMTRAEFEHDEVVKKQMLHDMLRDRAEEIITEEDATKQETMAQTQLRQNLKDSLQRADIQVHEDSDYESGDEGDHSHPGPAGVSPY